MDSLGRPISNPNHLYYAMCVQFREKVGFLKNRDRLLFRNIHRTAFLKFDANCIFSRKLKTLLNSYKTSI